MLLAVRISVMDALGSLESTQEARVALGYRLEHLLRLLRPVYTGDFVAATRCNFCLAKIASSFKHVRNPCDIATTNRTKNRTWFTRAILKLQP